MLEMAYSNSQSVETHSKTTGRSGLKVADKRGYTSSVSYLRPVNNLNITSIYETIVAKPEQPLKKRGRTLIANQQKTIIPVNTKRFRGIIQKEL